MESPNRRLTEALVYFARSTQFSEPAKLGKLCYLLDVGHFQQTGRSVTGGSFIATATGPTPRELDSALRDHSSPLRARLRFRTEGDTRAGLREVLAAPSNANVDVFTPRQLDWLERVSRNFATKYAEQIDVSKFDHGAWITVWANGDGIGDPIPLELCIEGFDRSHPAVVRSLEDRYEAAAATAGFR